MPIRNPIIRLQYFAMGYALACVIGCYGRYIWAINTGIILMWINLWIKDNQNANNKSHIRSNRS